MKKAVAMAAMNLAQTMEVAVMKRKEDFMILRADTSNMDEEVKATHMFICDAILQEVGIRRAAATSTTATTGE
jgi:hypothetical protein